MNFNYIVTLFSFKDFLRILCGSLFITRSMLLIIDDSFLEHRSFSESSLFFSFSIIYLFSILYLVLGLFLLFGVKTKKQLLISFFVVTPTFALAYFDKNFVTHDLILCSITFFLVLLLLFIGSGNMTVDKLFTD